MSRALAMGALLLLAACSVAAERTGSSEQHHTEGELIWANSPYLWGEIDRTKADAKEGGRVQPSDHAVAVRLQGWVDRFDGLVRSMVREQTGQTLVAPKPQVRLHASPDVNAWIAMDAMCIAKAVAPAPKQVDLVVMSDPRTMMRNSFETECYGPKNWPDQSAGGLEFFNRLGGVQIAVEPDAILIKGGFPEDRANNVAIRSATSFVNVNSGLVAAMGEKSTATVLAHELGHYYRAHLTTSVAERYDFFFDRDEHLPERPTPVAEQSEYRKKYEGFRLPRFAVDGLRHSARLGPTLVRWASDMRAAAGHACEPFARAPREWKYQVGFELGYDSGRDLSVDARAAYLDLEAKADACFDALELDDATETSFPLAANTMPRKWFTSRLASPFAASEWKEDLSAVKTLRELVQKVEDRAHAIDTDAKSFDKRLVENRIGLYTFEQEADEIAMELAARIGIAPDEAIGAFVELMNAGAQTTTEEDFKKRNAGFSAAECKSLLDSGFQRDGKSVYVGLGSLYEPHHATCYRIFNLWREKRAHGYRVAKANFPEPTPAWGDLQAQAKSLTDGAPKPVPAPPTSKKDAGAPGEGTTDPEPAPETSEWPSNDEPTSEPAASPASAPVATTTTSGCSAAPAAGESSSLSAFAFASLAMLVARARRRR